MVLKMLGTALSSFRISAAAFRVSVYNYSLSRSSVRTSRCPPKRPRAVLLASTPLDVPPRHRGSRWCRNISRLSVRSVKTTGKGQSMPAYAEREFRRYLECGILAYGFARARCGECGHDFLLAFSCKGRAVCPSCNTRRMAESAAHLVDHVLAPLPVRQWVVSLPKRLRYPLHHERKALNGALRIFLEEIERHLHTQSPGAAADSRTGAVAFIHTLRLFAQPAHPFPCLPHRRPIRVRSAPRGALHRGARARCGGRRHGPGARGHNHTALGVGEEPARRYAASLSHPLPQRQFVQREPKR